MRTALLSAVKRDETGGLRATASLAGRTVLGWQIDFALELGCERVVCLYEAPTPELLALQRETESDGAEFHLIRSNVQLVALLRTGDQLLTVMDGLLTTAIETTLFENVGDRLRPMIYAMPSASEAAQRFAEDFERIDAERHWAGLAVVGSGTVQKLADCPPDGEPMSLLLRLALQDGAECRMLAKDGFNSYQSLVASSNETLISKENSLITQAQGDVHWAGPFLALSKVISGKIVRSSSTVSPIAFLASTLTAFLIAAILFWLNLDAVALLLVSAGVIFGYAALALENLRASLHSHILRGRGSYPSLIPTFLDLFAVAALTVAVAPETAPIERLALPFFAIGLARIAAQTPDKRMVAFWSDRGTQLLAFAMAAFGGVLPQALAVFGLGALTYNLLRNRRK